MPIKPPRKSKMPESGPLHWTKCYYAQGDEIKWLDMEDRPHTGIVEKAKRNKFGRVSYQTTAGSFVLLEAIADAIKRKSTA